MLGVVLELDDVILTVLAPYQMRLRGAAHRPDELHGAYFSRRASHLSGEWLGLGF
jgi:hypothetical protein